LIEELKDTEKLGKRGEAYVVGQFVLMFAVLFPLVDLSVLTRLLGVGALGLGGAIIVAGSSDLASSLTPLPVPRKNAKLVKDGMYQYMRHPLYTGLFLASSGLAAVTHDSTRTLFAVGLLVLLSFKADYEERELKEMFGADYEEYAEQVKRFWFL
jgi:protein-S-isoprenylcysteine O-methyltransferase Ste14